MQVRILKLLVVILLFMVGTMFKWYHEADLRELRNSKLDDLRWHAQLDAFALHAKMINIHSDFIFATHEDKS